MVIVYGYKNYFKREAALEPSVCPNCGHMAHHTLTRHINEANLFYVIPIFKTNLEQGAMCENCGIIHPMDKKTYKELKKQIQNQPQNPIQGQIQTQPQNPIQNQPQDPVQNQLQDQTQNQ